MNRLKLALIFRQYANWGLKGISCLIFPKTHAIIENFKSQKGNILILRTGNIGDTACALPALAAIRDNFPQANICLLTSPGRRGLPEAREMVEGLGLVDEIITFYNDDFQEWSFRLKMLRELRRRRFDLFVLLPQGRSDLQRAFRDLLFARLLGVKGALGFVLGNYFPWFDLRTLKDYVPPHNEVERLLLLLAQAGINGIRPFSLNLPASCRQRANLLLEPCQKLGQPLIGLQVHAKAQAKQWPRENFAKLGRRLHETFQPLFLLFGGPGDRESLESLADRFPDNKLVVAGEVTVLETAALLAHCDVLITLDTGPMHLAALLGTPIVALFSARHFEKMWEPHIDRAIVLRKSVPCELCFQEDCDQLTCMRAITVEEVLQAVQYLLPEKGPNNAIPAKTL